MQKKHMTRVLTASALALGLISAATTASAEGIAVTRHNLGSSNRNASGSTVPSNPWVSSTYTGIVNAGNQYLQTTDEICVFCHTPHGAQNMSVVNAPLWNRLAGTATYMMYSTGTMQCTAAQLNGSGSMSLACLSCHDGTQAMDSMINKPGSSGFATSGSRIGGNWYSGTSLKTSGVGGLGDGFIGTVPTVGTFDSAVILGTNLSNDHPIGMAYCGGGQAAVGSLAGCADTDFNPQVSGANGSFWVGTSSTQKENMRTYGTSPATATVECGSCHDPHSAVNRTFLRTSNAGSAVCLTCHAK